ncbi:MAG: ribonuclease P protein component [Candidatus Babeliaceae bacterium]
MSFTLKSRQEITKTLKRAFSVCKYPELEIRVAPIGLPGRLLLIIPKRVGNAPQRNRIRRRLKAIFVENKLFELPYNWVFFIKPGIQKWTFVHMKEVILVCATKLLAST